MNICWFRAASLQAEDPELVTDNPDVQASLDYYVGLIENGDEQILDEMP